MLTIEQKAVAFDLISSGIIQGMSEFWKNYDELKELPDDEVLRMMGQFACKEAIEFGLGLGLED